MPNACRSFLIPKLLSLKLTDSAVFIGAVSLIIQLFGGWDLLMNALLIFVAVDYLSGLMVAVGKKKLSSKIGFEGLIKKVFIFLLVLISAQLDKVLLNHEAYFRMMTALFYISNEGISIIENAAMLGLPVPKPIHRVLEQLKEDYDR
ncbi:phage holin family protein [Alkalibacter mobilis]|uniref:phage holin family protein n=1 Tax=Alkalibacter mobilis TaxID=2787712 RepID=UPI001CEC13FA|nr:phage holin family protein [Alkalibacter mobilis]